jgi:hypothetical protein
MGLLVIAGVCAALLGQHDAHGGHAPWNSAVASSETLHIGGAVIQVDFAPGTLDQAHDVVLSWVRRAAEAVAVYYGRFPVDRARVLIVPVSGESGVLQGTTWGGVGGFPAFTRMRLGQHTSAGDLADDWTMTHELVHTALPALPDEDHWLEEGLATYVEPIARGQAGQLTAEKIWADMMRDMPKGEPASGDAGLENTESWASTYWGGALFCLAADVAIRERTGNRKGLQDALRGVLAAGGSIDKDWHLAQVIETGDRATGTTVLAEMYAHMGKQHGPVDLDALWMRLGVSRPGATVVLDDHAPLAAVRRGITAGR